MAGRAKRIVLRREDERLAPFGTRGGGVVFDPICAVVKLFQRIIFKSTVINSIIISFILMVCGLFQAVRMSSRATTGAEKGTMDVNVFV